MNKDSKNRIIEIFEEAVNDWPNDITECPLMKYVTEIEKYIAKESTYNNINSKINKIDYSKEAWFGESLSVVLQVFHLYKEKNITLKEIVLTIEEDYNQKIK